MPDDPFRDDAALVFRAMRDGEGPQTALVLADACFPTPTEGPPSSLATIRKRSLRRVFDSLVWMRHHGVVITAVPSPEGETRFVLGAHAVEVTPLVTAKVSQATDVGGEIMDVWGHRD